MKSHKRGRCRGSPDDKSVVSKLGEIMSWKEGENQNCGKAVTNVGRGDRDNTDRISTIWTRNISEEVPVLLVRQQYCSLSRSLLYRTLKVCGRPEA